MSAFLGSLEVLFLDFLHLSVAWRKTDWRESPLRCFISKAETWRTLRLVHEELHQKLEDAVIQTHHRSVLHALVQSQALGAPQEVFPGVVGVRLHRERHCVELVAEEGEELAVRDHSLGHERPGDVLVVPETCRRREGTNKCRIKCHKQYTVY